MSKPYAELGRTLAEAREQSSLDQAELAALLGCKQQSISRWETGASRPRATEIARVAAALGLDADRLMELAGYDSSALPTISFAQPFPFENLDPETFERSVEYLLAKIYRDAAVTLAGSPGHTQDGLDIVVRLNDGTRHSFQCKRVARFGPAEVEKAIAAHTAQADKKHLVLSRVASPQAAEALYEHKGWDLWDKHVLSRKIRQELTEDDQNRFVDIFFHGRRRELLGRAEPGPWLTTKEFFEPFERPNSIFSHQWTLQGRETDIDKLLDALRPDGAPVVLVTGAGGIGKSRLLKEALARLGCTQPDVTVRFLSPSAEISRANPDTLGRGAKLLVVDDAHDRDGLSALFQYAAVERNNARILLASRPYAQSRILQEAALYGIGGMPTVSLERLNAEQMQLLVRDVLLVHGGLAEWAEPIASAVRDSPLVAVMAARVIARDGIAPEMARSNDELRNVVLGKFRKVVTGEMGSPADQKLIPGLLDVLALVQPFHIEDPQLIDLLRTVKGMDDTDTVRLLRLLVDGGVVYRRGHQYRLMPDLLGDYIIETSCLGPNETLSPLAQRVFDAVPPSLLGHVLVNLGRLDWRKSGGDPSDSHLLDGIWRKLEDIDSEYDPRNEAIRSVAIYQPHQALNFVHNQVEKGRASGVLSPILKSIAYNFKFLDQACELLWELGRDDPSELGRHYNHPVRVLSELVGFEEHKPLEFNRRAFNFAIGLLDRPDAWDSHYSPFEVLKPFLSGEGVTTKSTGRTVVMSSFIIDIEKVEPMRQALIGRVLDLLSDARPSVARRAADFLEDTLRPPMGTLGGRVPQSVYDRYYREFADTMTKVTHLVARGGLRATTLIGIAKSVSWHAHYGPDATTAVAQAVLDAMPTDLDFRVRAALSDGFGQTFIGKFDSDEWQKRCDAWINSLKDELRCTHPDPESLRQYLEAALADLREAAGADPGSALILTHSLLRDSPDLARAFVNDAIAHPTSETSRYFAAALNQLLAIVPDEGRAIARRTLQSAEPVLARLTAGALSGLRRETTKADLDLMGTALGSPDPVVMGNAVYAIGTWETTSPRSRIDLLRRVHLENAPALLDRYCLLFNERQPEMLDALTRDDVLHILKRMLPIAQLEGYWTQEFLVSLSRRFPHELSDFFFQRVELASNREAYGRIRPVNHGPYAQRQLRFRESPEAGAILAKTWAWLRANEHRDQYFQLNAADLFDAMFLSARGPGVDSEMMALFESKVDIATSAELRLIARILRHAPHGFIFEQRSFVVRFLGRCKIFGEDLVARARDDLLNSAVSGVRQSLAGEPCPRDVEMQAKANETLKAISRLSPAYRLYDDVRRSAEHDIQRARRDAEAFDE